MASAFPPTLRRRGRNGQLALVLAGLAVAQPAAASFGNMGSWLSGLVYLGAALAVAVIVHPLTVSRILAALARRLRGSCRPVPGAALAGVNLSGGLLGAMAVSYGWAGVIAAVLVMTAIHRSLLQIGWAWAVVYTALTWLFIAAAAFGLALLADRSGLYSPAVAG